jgi:hypothetical protein
VQNLSLHHSLAGTRILCKYCAPGRLSSDYYAHIVLCWMPLIRILIH